jgi:RNA polymerase sigma factor (sigma-70 family)
MNKEKKYPIIDNDTLDQWRKGDLSSFPRVRNILNIILYKWSGNNDIAEEAVQETLVRVLCQGGMDTFQNGRDLKPWLVSSAINAATDIIRKRRRQIGAISYNRLTEEDGSECIALLEDRKIKEDLLLNEYREDQIKIGARKVLDFIIARSNEGSKSFTAFYLVKVLGITYFQAARLSGIENGTVRSGINRARAQLRREFADLERLIEHLPYNPRLSNSPRLPSHLQPLNDQSQY